MTTDDLFEPPKPGRRESKLGLDRVRAKVARIEKKLAAGAATEAEMNVIASLRRRLIRGEAEAREQWEKVFGK